MQQRKWRPSFKCIYVIPEIKGNAKSLEIILNRILPLRKFINQEDMVIFLGNYIDGEIDGHTVLDMLIAVKNEYGDRAIFLRGQQEDLALKAITGSHFNFNDWMICGGEQTLTGYRERLGIATISQSQLKTTIPSDHIRFLNSLETIYKLDDYFFFHGGFNPAKSIAENSIHNFICDDTSSKYIKDCLNKKQEIKFIDNYIFIGSKNFNSKQPLIHPKYFALGGSAPRKIFIFELNSMTACAIQSGKQRIYKYNFKYVE